MVVALSDCSRKIWITLGLIGLLIISGTARSDMFVYELPDGSRMVTDHALRSKHFRLVRSSGSIKGVGVLLASRNRQFFRVDPTAYDHLIRRMAIRYRMDFALIKAVMHAESAFNPYATSRKGAQGLMQLMPRTAKQYGVEDAFDPVQNIDAGVRHLKYLSKIFRNRPQLVVAAYNAGANAVKRHRGIPPYRETRKYVKKVLRYKRHYASLY